MPSKQNLRDQARFVFRGTVQKTRSTTLTQVAPSESTAVVRVDQIIRGPDILADFAGRNITVQLPKGRQLKPQDQEIFYTNSSVLAEGLAVEVLEYEKPAGRVAALAMASADDPAERLKHHDLNSRVSNADIVISGRVRETKLADEPDQPIARAAADTAATTTRVSEHMPLWRDAVIEVKSVHKGQLPGKTAVVRFPASNDVRWHRAVKFSPGQEGFFLLHKESQPEDRPKGRARTRAAAAASAADSAGAGVYTALHPLDFQPYDASDAVQQIIKNGQSGN